MKPVKLGIIGCGIAAKDLHYPALQKLKHKFEITAVCNHTEPKAKQFADMVGGVPYVLDYHVLLKREDVEAVDIILPIHLNYQVTKDSLDVGKHVIVEKPLAHNLTKAQEMLEFDKSYPQVKMVGENFRYHPVFLHLKKLLSQGVIGTPYSVFWNVFHLIEPTNKYAQTQWRIDHQYPGGFITDGGVHNIAAIRDLFGDFVSGSAFAKSINPALGELDTFSFQFKTKQNIDGVLNLYFSSNGYSENRIIILSDKASIIIENNTLTIKQKNRPDVKEIIEDDGGYTAEFEDFYDAIRNGKKVTASFEESYWDLDIIIKALEAAETGNKVEFL